MVVLHDWRLAIDQSWRQVLVAHVDPLARLFCDHVLLLIENASTYATRHIAGHVLSLVIFVQRTLQLSSYHSLEFRINVHLLAESVDFLASVDVVSA